MLVHPRLVVGEVFVHSEGGLGRPVGHQLHHDLVDVSLDGVALLSVDLVFLVGDVVAGVVSSPVTLGSGGSL